MAPAKGAKGAKSVKRTSLAPPPSPGPKKPRLDPLMKGVLDAIHQAEGLPEGCRAMLAASVPGCLGTPVAERHECQSMVVAWIGEVVDCVQAQLQKAVDAAEAEETSAQQREAELERQVAEVKVALERADVASKEQELREAAGAVDAAQAEAQEAEKRSSARLTEVGKLEAAMKLLRDEGTQVQERMQELVPLAQQAGLEESLLVALPPAATKSPSERTNFDEMVLERLEAALHERIPVLQAEAGEDKVRVEAAKAAVDVAKGAQQSAQEALESVRAEKRQAEEALAKAEADKEALVQGRAGAVAAREEKKTALQNFTGYNVECFTMLRDKAVAAAAA